MVEHISAPIPWITTFMRTLLPWGNPVSVGERYLVSDWKDPWIYKIINKKMSCDQMLGILCMLLKTRPWKIWGNKSGLGLESSEFFLQNGLCGSVGSQLERLLVWTQFIWTWKEMLPNVSFAIPVHFTYYEITNYFLPSKNRIWEASLVHIIEDDDVSSKFNTPQNTK